MLSPLLNNNAKQFLIWFLRKINSFILYFVSFSYGFDLNLLIYDIILFSTYFDVKFWHTIVDIIPEFLRKFLKNVLHIFAKSLNFME